MSDDINLRKLIAVPLHVLHVMSQDIYHHPVQTEGTYIQGNLN